MAKSKVKMDGKGRILIPKHIRKAAQLNEGSYIHISSKGKIIVIEPVDSVADKYFGAFKITKWPEDLYELMVETAQKWHD
jgi:AbrB family looped-hinge helix DNA binding protein